MSELKHDLESGRLSRRLAGTTAVAVVALVIAVLALLVKSGERGRSDGVAPSAENTLKRAQKTGVMRVGYGGFPPYTILNPNEADPNKRVSGFSVDLVEEIAKLYTPPLKVEWHRFSWETMKHDVEKGEFDFVADPVYQTVPRAMDFELCEPYSYFGIAVAVVKKDETRFKTFDDLDRADIVIALAKGWTSSEFAEKRLTKPKWERISVSEKASTQLDYVSAGRADVALNDVPTVAQYVREHGTAVKALWLENPPSSVAGGFLLAKGQSEYRDFLNVCTRVLKANGTLLQLDRKWKTYGYFDAPARTAGAGLSEK